MALQVPTNYFTAVYVLVSMLLTMLLVLLVYVLCSKRYRLNWYERNLLESSVATDKDVSGTPKSASSLGSNRSERKFFAGGGGAKLAKVHSTSDLSDQFWVPPGHLRQSTEIQSSEVGSLSIEDPGSVPPTPITPLGIKLSQFSTTHHASVDHINPPVKPVMPQQPTRPKLASMHSKLDHTKINASIYQRKLIKQQSGSIPEEMLGSLNFSLEYNKDCGLLNIRLIQARDLVSRDLGGTSDPYCKIYLLPDKKIIKQTQVIKKTLNPEFEEDFIFEVAPDEMSSQSLEILIYDQDLGSTDECIGHVLLPLEHIDMSEKVSLWKGISSCEHRDDEIDYGDLMFSLAYLCAAERLTVVILKAQNLRSVEESKSALDPYVKVSIIHQGKRLKKKKTTTKRNTTSPVFNEALVFGLSKDLLKSISLEFTVIHDNLLLANKEVLGRLIISSDSKGEELAQWKDMIHCKNAVGRWHRLGLS